MIKTFLFFITLVDRNDFQFSFLARWEITTNLRNFRFFTNTSCVRSSRQLVEFEITNMKKNEKIKNCGDSIESHSTKFMWTSFVENNFWNAYMFPQEECIDMKIRLELSIHASTIHELHFRVYVNSHPLIHSTTMTLEIFKALDIKLNDIQNA